MSKEINEQQKPQKNRKTKEQLLEILRYLIVGTTTTLINWGVSVFMEEVVGVTAGLNTAVAWIVSVIFFAFWAYKLFVFRSKSFEKRLVLREFIEFISARLLTFGFEWLFMFLFVDVAGFNQKVFFGFERVVESGGGWNFGFTVKELYIFKFFATVIVTILNYIASKLIIFKKREPEEETAPAEDTERPADPE